MLLDQPLQLLTLADMGQANRVAMGVGQRVLQGAIETIEAMQILTALIKGLITSILRTCQDLAIARLLRAKTGTQWAFKPTLAHFQAQIVRPAGQRRQCVEGQGFGVWAGQRIEVQAFIREGQAHLLLRPARLFSEAQGNALGTAHRVALGRRRVRQHFARQNRRHTAEVTLDQHNRGVGEWLLLDVNTLHQPLAHLDGPLFEFQLQGLGSRLGCAGGVTAHQSIALRFAERFDNAYGQLAAHQFGAVDLHGVRRRSLLITVFDRRPAQLGAGKCLDRLARWPSRQLHRQGCGIAAQCAAERALANTLGDAHRIAIRPELAQGVEQDRRYRLAFHMHAAQHVLTHRRNAAHLLQLGITEALRHRAQSPHQRGAFPGVRAFHFMVPEASAVALQYRLIGLGARGMEDAVLLGQRVLLHGIAFTLQWQHGLAVVPVQALLIRRH